jgi:hypothetical protein
MGDWYALEVLEQAIDDTKQLFLPFDLKTWLKMGLVTLVAGGAGGLNMPSPSMPGSSGTGSLGSQSGGITGNIAALDPAMAGAVVVGLLVLALVLGWLFVSAVMRFVFVRICSTRDVERSDRFSSNMENGWRLFGFEILLGLAFLAVAGLGVLVFTSTGMVGGGSLWSVIPSMLGGVLGLFTIALVWAVIMGLTNDFVIVQMLDADVGLRAAWTDAWQVFKEEWKQLLVYWLLKIALGIAVGIITVVLFIATLLAFALAGLVMALPVALLYNVLEVVGIVVGAFLGLALLMAFAAVMVSLTAPLKTFMRYYGLRVYEKMFDTAVVTSLDG